MPNLNKLHRAGSWALEQDELKDGMTWGPWRFDANTLELIHGKGHQAYAVDLERCGSSQAILDWILQVGGKSWIDEAALGHLVRALDDIFEGLQGKVCPWGIAETPGKVFDPTGYIEQRLKDR